MCARQDGVYGVMVSTRACGALSSGSNPDRHPFYFTQLFCLESSFTIKVVVKRIQFDNEAEADLGIDAPFEISRGRRFSRWVSEKLNYRIREDEVMQWIAGSALFITSVALLAVFFSPRVGISEESSRQIEHLESQIHVETFRF
mgnify:CR=1 FL=1